MGASRGSASGSGSRDALRPVCVWARAPAHVWCERVRWCRRLLSQPPGAGTVAVPQRETAAHRVPPRPGLARSLQGPSLCSSLHALQGQPAGRSAQKRGGPCASRGAHAEREVSFVGTHRRRHGEALGRNRQRNRREARGTVASSRDTAVLSGARSTRLEDLREGTRNSDVSGSRRAVSSPHAEETLNAHQAEGKGSQMKGGNEVRIKGAKAEGRSN